MNEKELFAEKLKALLIERGYKPMASVLEREFNLRHYGKPIGLHAFASWLRGETMPRPARLRTLAEWLNVPVSDLVSDELAYKLDRVEKEKELSKHIWEEAASYQDQTVIKLFLNLPSEQKKVVREVIMAMDKAYRK
ncbi:hypothetical protein [Basfia succiniciproducens]|uniref:HTH cro/C1-type domain-containing protein n=1 Tax=Basfia succiniciproducens TaxID=653940 RepID=A0A1G5ASX3_9PAST|nr:hypothetical protein [Basfia succiniciproducens]QIM69724.1 hypothetical protein A4G13_10100 [Basfia succiniciproducens]SCX81007.1 hypothetical protein SAMN02910354_00442 [Basfia succiniciproducens]